MGGSDYYLADSGVKDPRLDTNVCAYVATGAWHHYVSTEDLGFLEELWPIVDRALAFVLRWQLADGTVRWSVDPDGRFQPYALLTGSSSIYHALRCGVACAEVLGHERPDWELAAGRIAHAWPTRRTGSSQRTSSRCGLVLPGPCRSARR